MVEKFGWDKKEVKNSVEGDKETKEALDLIYSSVVFENLLKNIAETKSIDNQKERDNKITKIAESFSKDALIVYQDETWWVKEIKDIKWFLKKVAKWETTIDFSIDVEQYAKEWAITLDKTRWKNWVDNIRIKKVKLNADYLK